MVFIDWLDIDLYRTIDSRNYSKAFTKMMEWEHSILLVLTPLILLMVVGRYLYIRRTPAQIKDLISEENSKRIGLDSMRLGEFKQNLFLLTSVLLMIIAIANPRIPGKEVEVEHKGSDIIIALDISQSMLVRDVAPNRLSKAIRFSSELIQSIPGERYGLIFFAGSAFTQMPLSQDAKVALLLLKNANPAQSSNQGTAIGDAIELATEMFDDEPGRGKALIIISDGEDHDSKTLEKLEVAVINNIHVIAVGVGTPQGGTVPEKYLGQETVIKDESRKPVISRFNPAFMNKIAAKSRGEFFTINETGQAKTKIKEIVSRLEKGELATQKLIDYESVFQVPLMLSILFFGWWIWGKKESNTKRIFNE